MGLKGHGDSKKDGLNLQPSYVPLSRPTRSNRCYAVSIMISNPSLTTVRSLCGAKPYVSSLATMSEHVRAQDTIHSAQMAPALSLEPVEHILIHAQ